MLGCEMLIRSPKDSGEQQHWFRCSTAYGPCSSDTTNPMVSAWPSPKTSQDAGMAAAHKGVVANERAFLATGSREAMASRSAEGGQRLRRWAYLPPMGPWKGRAPRILDRGFRRQMRARMRVAHQRAIQLAEGTNSRSGAEVGCVMPSFGVQLAPSNCVRLSSGMN